MTIQQTGNAASSDVLWQLLQFEQKLRQAQTTQQIMSLLVNQLRTLVTFNSASFLATNDSKARTEIASDVVKIDHNAPFIRWQSVIISHYLQRGEASLAGYLDLESCADLDPRGYSEWGGEPPFWLPLPSPNGEVRAGLWISRCVPFAEHEKALLERVAEVAGHALNALTPRGRLSIPSSAQHWVLGAVLVCVLGAMFIPVRQTALAPAEVIALNPSVVTAPMNGVIATVMVSPNERVREGQLLAVYEDTDAQGRLAIAQEELLVAQSELLNARQASLVDPRVKGEVAVLESRLKLRQTERDYAQQILTKVEITSPRNGVVVFRDKDDLEGLPIETGQAIFAIAEPSETELEIELPVSEALSFAPGSEVVLYLNQSPLDPVPATLLYSSYHAEPTPAGVLSYRLKAAFSGKVPPQLGQRGTAKLEGEEVSLFYFLFRRPMSALRQSIGW